METKNKKQTSNTNLFLFTILVSLFAFALIAAPVSAYENYQLTAPFSPVTVASCAAQTEVLALKNAGDEAAQLTLTFANSAVDKFAQISPSQLFLVPGESKTVTIFVNAPCQTQGTYDYAINVHGNAISQVFDRTLQINKISNVDFVATKGNVLQSCPCVPQTVPFTITNTGSWAESYTVTAIGNEENIAVPQGKLFLAPGQTFSGAAFVNFACSTYGTKDFKLEVTSTNSQFKATIPFQYDIAACYDYTLGLDKTVNVCEQDTGLAVAVVNNSAAYTNTFDINANLPSFAKLDGNQVTLGAQQVGIAPLIFAPTRGDAGKYTYDVTIVSRLGKFTAQQYGTLNVQKCYEYNIATANDNTDFAVCQPGEKLVFTITNNGELTQEMHVNSTNKAFTSSPSVFTLSAGASKDIVLNVPASGVVEKTDFNIQVWAKNNPSIIAAKKITLQPKDLKTCYGVTVSPDTFIVNNSAKTLDLKVTNDGIRSANYNVTLVSPQWIKLLNNSVYIAAKSSAFISLRSKAPVFVENGSYALNVSFETPFTQQIEPVLVILNPQTAQWLLWFMIVVLLILVALLIILLAARRARRTIGQPGKSRIIEVIHVTPIAKKQVVVAPPKPKKLTAAQKRALRNERRRNKKNAASGWRRVLVIILVVAVLLALLLSLLIQNNNSNNNQPPSSTKNTTGAPNMTAVPSKNTTAVNATVANVTQTNATNSTITGSVTGSTGVKTNATTNITTNVSTRNNSSGANISSSNESNSFWRIISDFFGSFKIFGADSNKTITLNATNVTQANISTLVNQTNLNQTAITNVSNVTNLTNVNLTNTNLTNSTQSIINDTKKMQRDADLAAANAFLADPQAIKSNRVFVLAQNSRGKLNLSHYFVDFDNLTLTYEFKSVNASKTTAFITDDMLYLEPFTNFVGIQTFRIVATNQVNLSTTSPIFTLVVLDQLPQPPLSQSVQVGLLILLIVIAFIVYFDIRLIAKQYEYARSAQNEKKRNK